MCAADNVVDVVVHRRWVAQGTGHSAIYVPLALDVRFNGEHHTIRGLDVLDYENSHHNWNDSLRATSGDLEVRWSVRSDFNDPVDFLVYEVNITSGDVVVVPTTRVFSP